MNERIKEFAKQAGFYKYGDDFEDIIEKFAQLIVRECLEQIDKMCDGFEADNEDKQALGAQWCGLAVARHFGVEE